MVNPANPEDPTLLSMSYDMGRKETAIQNLKEGMEGIWKYLKEQDTRLASVEKDTTKIKTRLTTWALGLSGGITAVVQGLVLYLSYLKVTGGL